MDDELKLKWMFQPDSGIYAELAPITSMKEFWRCQWQLQCVFEHADPDAWRGERLYYRGDSSWKALGDKRWVVSADKLKKTLETCRQQKLIECNDSTLYLLMRHADIKCTALLDWTLSPEVAVWFAIHGRDGKLKDQEKDDAVLWVFRPIAADDARYNGPDGVLFPENGGNRSVIYFPYEDPREFEGLSEYVAYHRPTMQQAAAIRLRFSPPDKNGNRHLWPMDEDPNFKGRLLRIGIEGDFKSIDDELNDWLRDEQQWKIDDSVFREYLGISDTVKNYVLPDKLVTELNSELESEVKNGRKF